MPASTLSSKALPAIALAVILVAPAVRAVAATDPVSEIPPRKEAGELTRRTYDVVFDGSALLASTTAGLVSYDVSSPASPSISLTQLFPGSGSALAVDGDRAYLCLGPDGLRILDVSDPLHPS